MASQLSLLKIETQYGGSYSRGVAKTRRPLSTKKPVHVTLKSSKAVGDFRLTRYRKEIQAILFAQAQRWNVKILERSINTNHIHMALFSKSRGSLQNFFRAVSGLIARKVTGAKKGRPFGRFWDEVIWSRIVEWGKALTTLIQYVQQNTLECLGLIPYTRKSKNRKRLRT